MTTRRITMCMAAAALVFLAAAPAAFAGKKPNGNVRADLVWPLPPDKPRIRLIQVLHGASDVEPLKKAGFLDRLAGIEKRQFKPAFLKPYGIATDSAGRVYVTDSGQGLVFVFDQEKKKVTYLGRDPQLRLYVPIGITVDAKDRVWVADAIGQHVVAYAPEGGILTVLGKGEEMQNPVAVAVDDARNRVYVADSKRHAVLVYNPDTGELIHTLGKRGSEKGEFNFPTNLALDREGRLYVTDTMNCRVQIFDPDYNFVDTFGAQGRRRGDFLKPKGIAVDAWGNIYVTDADFDNLQVFDQQKRLLLFLGTAGQAPGAFWLPAGIHIDRRNRIYIADQNNRRIQVFQLLDGSPALAPLQERAGGEAKGGDAEPK